MGITIKDIAMRAGVSKTTVSFAFNDPQRISAETYERIMTIAREIGYAPDPVARILSNKKTKNIGIVLPQTISVLFQNPYLGELLRGVGSVCDQEGFAVSVLSPFKGLVSQTILNAAVDGILILGISRDSDVHTSFKQRNMPYVTIDAIDTGNFVNVGIRDENLAEQLMDVLLDNNHRRICFCLLQSISPDLQKADTSATREARLHGIYASAKKHALTRTDLEQFSFISTPATLSDSYNIAVSVLKKKDRPTAIYCMADVQAYGFYRAARELDITIPDDLSIVSFDDIPITEIITPGLTCVHQSAYTKGRTATQLLFRLIAGKPCDSVFLDAHVEHRDSVIMLPKPETKGT